MREEGSIVCSSLKPGGPMTSAMMCDVKRELGERCCRQSRVALSSGADVILAFLVVVNVVQSGGVDAEECLSKMARRL